MGQVYYYVRPGLTKRVPAICMLLSSPFQEHVSYFEINVLLLLRASIIEETVGIKIQEAGSLANLSS